MAQKKLSELTFNDVGKHAVITEANGDRNSGEIGYIQFMRAGAIAVQVGGTTVRGAADDSVEISDGPAE